MTFSTTFMPIAGAGCGLFLCGMLWHGYRFFDLYLTSLSSPKKKP